MKCLYLLAFTIFLIFGCMRQEQHNSEIASAKKDHELIELAKDVISRKKPEIETSQIRFKEISWEEVPGGKKYVAVEFIMTNTISVAHSNQFVTTNYTTIRAVFHPHIGIDREHGYISSGHYSIKNFSKTAKLQKAVFESDTDLVKKLIAEGVDVNAVDSEGETLLHNAVSHANKEIIQLLLDAGANLDATNEDGNTPLMRASFSGDKPVVELLIERGGDINEQNKNGNSPLIAATMYQHYQTVKYLLQEGVKPNLKNNECMTALHWAVAAGNANIVKLLLENGADPSIEDADGNDPMTLAVKMGKKELVMMMREDSMLNKGSGSANNNSPVK